MSKTHLKVGDSFFCHVTNLGRSNRTISRIEGGHVFVTQQYSDGVCELEYDPRDPFTVIAMKDLPEETP